MKLPFGAAGALVLLCVLGVACEIGSSGPTPIPEEGGLVAGRLEPGEADRFTFTARRGALVTLALRDDSDGERADAVLAVFAEGFESPEVRVDDVGRSLAPRLAFVVARSGSHTAVVSGFGDADFDGGDHAQAFDYRLALAVAPSPPELVEEREAANDDALGAEPTLLDRGGLLPRGAALLTGELTPGDVDHYLLPLPSGAVVTASVYEEDGGERHDSVLRLLGPRAEAVLAEDDDAGPGLLSRVVYRVPDGPPRDPAILAVEGYDPDPEDGAPHEERFRYRLVVSVEDDLAAPPPAP